MNSGHEVDLGAIPETLLWTLYNRVTEAKRPDSVISDPIAIDVFGRIDFPFSERFGRPHWSQAQALRALCFDRAVREFLESTPDATVVSLGEGLETQFWRVDNGRMQWVSVDLPEVIQLRERLLPSSSRLRSVAASALDTAWIDSADASRVLVTAQGLLMYLPRKDVADLIAACAAAFPDGEMLFDAVPAWLSASTLKGDAGSSGYVAPPMQWGVSSGGLLTETDLFPTGTRVSRLEMPCGRGPLFGMLLPALGSLRVIRAISSPLYPWEIVRVLFSGHRRST